MSLDHLSRMSAPVLSATLLMTPAASQYRPPAAAPASRPTRRPARSWKGILKSVARPFVPTPVRRKVRLVVISGAGVPRTRNPYVNSSASGETGRRAA